jgi:hypothetical protein
MSQSSSSLVAQAQHKPGWIHLSYIDPNHMHIDIDGEMEKSSESDLTD